MYSNYGLLSHQALNALQPHLTAGSTVQSNLHTRSGRFFGKRLFQKFLLLQRR